MVNLFVLDCSMAMAWFLPDESDHKTDRVLSSLELGQAVVPALWPFELANVLVVAQKRNRISRDESQKIINQLSKLPISVEHPPSSSRLAEVLDLACDHSLSAYDAAYLECASRLKLPLATKDAQLSRVAKRAEIELV